MSDTDPIGGGGGTDPVRVVDQRLLEGPNLYFPRPALKLELELPGCAEAGAEQMAALCAAVGMGRVLVGEPGSATRQRVTARLVERVLRAVAASAGVSRVGVRVRAGNSVDRVVLAAVWRDRARALAVAEAVPDVLVALVRGQTLAEAVEASRERVLSARGGPKPRVITPRIPVVGITGTNGKTSTTRLVAHLAMTAGRRTGWSSTDGIVVQGEIIEPGDYSGPAGSAGVLSAPGVEIGILETARGGMLLKGLGVSHYDVTVVTNVSADHLGLQGIDTVDQLAEVKAIITKVTKKSGWCVLNGEDPRVWAMHSSASGRPWAFALDPDSPALREALSAGGRAITVIDGQITVLGLPSGLRRLLPVVDVPMTLAGLSAHNLANALAGAAAGIALGLPLDAVVAGLRTFEPDDRLNPGRMNVYTAAVEGGEATVILDLAHNEAGLEALLAVARGLVGPGGRLLLGLGTAGDRTDEILEALGEIAGRGADQILVVHKERYRRGRSFAEFEARYAVGLARSGVAEVPSVGSELEGLQRLLAGATDGDVIALMTHADRAVLAEWLRDQGAQADDAAAVRRKAIIARGGHENDAEFDALAELADAELIAAAQRLVDQLPDDPRALYELAGAYDAAGEDARAVPLYEQALARGLGEPWRHRLLIQLASTLRNLGRTTQALAALEMVLADHPDSLGARAFRALVLHDLGRSDEAVADLVATIARASVDPDVERYRRALSHYAQALDHSH